MNIRTRIGGLAAAAVTVTLAACGNNTTAGTSTAGSTSMSMSMPQSVPMSSAGSEGGSAPNSGTVDAAHNDADITFTQMMLVHHQGAIEMADLAPERAASNDITQLATQIKAAQTPEIEQMTSWLKAWGAPMAAASSSAMGGMTGMDHGGAAAGSAGQMPGMMTDQQMQQLKAANGAAFDKMFLQLMISHHQGALEMAQTEKASGQNKDALALADAIIKSQTAEIAEMNKMLQKF